MSEPIVCARGIRKSFSMPGGDLHVLRGVDLDVEEGRILAILGASGWGNQRFFISLAFSIALLRELSYWPVKMSRFARRARGPASVTGMSGLSFNSTIFCLNSPRSKT